MKIAVAALVLLTSSVVSAQEVSVEPFRGPSGDAVRTQVLQAIERAELAVTEDAGTIVSGRVTRAGRRWRARITARSADGTELADRGFRARRIGALSAQVRRWAASELVPALGRDVPVRAEPPPREPAPRAQPIAPASEPIEPEAVAARAPSLPAPFAMRVGASIVHRTFVYNDDIFERLRPYELPAAPAVHAGLEWFPGGHTDLGVMRGLSVVAEAEVALGVESAEGEVAFATDAWSVLAGVRWSLGVDDFAFRFDAGYRAVVFTIHPSADGQTRAQIPNIEIHAVRAGGALRWDIGLGVFFSGQAAYLAPLALGEIGSAAWFPRATAGGVEGDLGLGVRVDDVELFAAFAARRFFYAMNPEPGDARVAGGAVDEYLSGAVHFTWSPRL